jgi:hypothetical protein
MLVRLVRLVTYVTYSRDDQHHEKTIEEEAQSALSLQPTRYGRELVSILLQAFLYDHVLFPNCK